MATYHNEQSKALFLSAYAEKINFLEALERNITAYQDKWYNQRKWRPADHPRLVDAQELRTIIDNSRNDTESLITALIQDIEAYLNEEFSNAKLSPLRLGLKSTLRKFQKTHPLSVLDGNLQLVQGYNPDDEATWEEDDTASHERPEAAERIAQLEEDLATARREAEERAEQLERDLAAARLEVVNKNAEVEAVRAERDRLRGELAEVTVSRDEAVRNHQVEIAQLRDTNLQLSAEKQASQAQIEALDSLLGDVQQQLADIMSAHSVKERRLGKGRAAVQEFDETLQRSHAKLIHLVESVIKRFIHVGRDTLSYFNGRNAEIKRQNKALIDDITQIVNSAEAEIAPENLVITPPRDDNSFFAAESSADLVPPTPPRPDGEPSKYILTDEMVLEAQNDQLAVLAASLVKRRTAFVSPPSTPAKSTPVHSSIGSHVPVEKGDSQVTPDALVSRVLDLEKPQSEQLPGQATKAAHTRQFAPASRIVGLTNMAQGRAADNQQIPGISAASTEATEATEVREEDSLSLNI